MTSTSMTPASRPRRGVVAALTVAAGAALVAALVVAGPADEAAAAELEAFSSCEELSEWGELSQQGGGSGEERFDAVGSEVGEAGSDGVQRELQSAGDASVATSGRATSAGPASTTAPAADADDAGSAEEDEGSASGADGDTTNVAVEGVDELDLIDRLEADVYLVATVGRLAIVDLAAAEVRAVIAVPHDAQITYDRDRAIAWVVGNRAEGGVLVERIAVGASDLTSDARWATSGQLVDARRVGGSLHLVATEGFPVAVPGGPEPVPGPAVDGPPVTGTIMEDVVEDPATEPGFEGGATEPAPGEVGPTETTVAPDAVVPTTTRPVEDPAAPETTIPAPDTTEPETTEAEPTEPPTSEPVEPTEPPTTEPVEPDPTVPFPEGPVPCDEVLHPIGPSSPEATLLVTLPATGDLEPTHAAEVVGAGSQVHVTLDAAYLATALHEGEPATSIHRFDLDTLTHTGSGRVEGGLLDEFSMSEHDGHLRVAVTTGFDTFGGREMTEAVGAPPEAIEDGAPVAADEAEVDDQASTSTAAEPPGRNEIVVLDTEGDLDVVGRTARFGKPGESIYGIRFTGDVAYAVTFLETDPFYVVDLSESIDERRP